MLARDCVGGDFEALLTPVTIAGLVKEERNPVVTLREMHLKDMRL